MAHVWPGKVTVSVYRRTHGTIRKRHQMPLLHCARALLSSMFVAFPCHTHLFVRFLSSDERFQAQLFVSKCDLF